MNCLTSSPSVVFIVYLYYEISTARDGGCHIPLEDPVAVWRKLRDRGEEEGNLDLGVMMIALRPLRRMVMYVAGIIVVMLLLYHVHSPCSEIVRNSIMVSNQQKYIYGPDLKEYPYDRDMPLIFIGGVPRSGTTLMRAMLDAHPDVRCGEETRVIPRILQMSAHWLKSEKESARLEEAGLDEEVLDSALAAFILEVIAKHGEAAPRLCNKDPFTLKTAVHLNKLFPNSRFILMVRDGRAVVHSIITRKVTISGFNLSDYRQCLSKWNTAIQTMHNQCSDLGAERCMHVFYEQLVLHPRIWLERILQFLDVPWNDSVLHHERLINKPGGVSLSKVERSTDQVIKPVNLEALSKWVGKMPKDVVDDMAQVAPMLAQLGYDPNANPPNYGLPDTFVADNTRDIERQQDLWHDKMVEVLHSSRKNRTSRSVPAVYNVDELRRRRSRRSRRDSDKQLINWYR